MKAAQHTIVAMAQARFMGLMRIPTLATLLVLVAGSVHGQSFETVGIRAQGLGGAFVAVASDSSATWWNPAGLAAGPFVDVSLSASHGGRAGERHPAWGVAVAAPMLGASYYRFQITEIQPFHSTDQIVNGRQETQAPVSRASHSASLLGISLVHSVASGIHVGTTVKAIGLGTDGDVFHRVDMDLGGLAVHRGLRVGASVRNVLRPAFGSSEVRLPRYARVGAAFDAEAAGYRPVVVSADVDLAKYESAGRERRMVAVGIEHWIRGRRVGVRAGSRINTVGAHETAMSAGASVALTSLMYVEGQVTGGASADQRWSVGARVTF